MFLDTTCAWLQELTITPPLSVNEWYGPWLSILFTSFPYSQRYEVGNTKHPNFLFEVNKLISRKPLQKRTVLIVKFKNSQHWPAGIPSLDGHINHLADAILSGDAISKVYWIEVVGPHWRYGVKEVEQDLKPLIAWHDTTHDQASYDDFQHLIALMADM